MPSASSFRFGAALSLAALGALSAYGQSDPLVSKSIPIVLADQSRFYAFAADGLKFSVFDPFATPPAIKTGAFTAKGGVKAGVEGGVGRTASALLWFNNRSDSATTGGIVSLDRDGKTAVDSFPFVRSKAGNNSINSGVALSALALWRDTVIVGGGRAGVAVARPKAGGPGVMGVDSLVFLSLPFGHDSAVTRIRCALAKACAVDSLSPLSRTHGDPDSVIALAVDSSAADSVWLLIATQTGLRRGLLGGSVFPKVALPGDTAAKTRIEGLHADPRNRILWVFTGSRFWFSDDHGRTFRVPPDVPGVATKPSADLKGFVPAPEAANLGDTSYVNFNIDRPGLVLFKKDSVLKNEGSGSPDDALLDEDDGLAINRGLGKLTGLAAARSGGATALVVGTTGKGLFYRLTGPGKDGQWVNVNSLKRLSGGLEEVITYPTLFTGTGPSGEPEFVNIGYRLKKRGKVTITVFNYAMEKVKVLVKGAPRDGGGSRSEKPDEDRWDGRDRSGRLVSVGTYYILVESDQGEKGWGKAIAVRGRN